MSARLDRRGFLKLGLTLPVAPLAAKLAALGRGGKAAAGDAPNLLVILFDTLSARHITHYGYRRETMPNLARFADRATVYHAHYAGGNFTTPGTTSLLTGAYPWSHRAFHIWGTADPIFKSKSVFGQIDPSVYTRIAYTHNPLVAFLLHQFGADIDANVLSRELTLDSQQYADRFFTRDFNIAAMAEDRLLRPPFYQFKPSSLFLSLLDKARRRVERQRLEEAYADQFPRGLPTHHETEYFRIEDAVDWVLSLFGGPLEPFFAYVHLWPPHHPYNPRREFIGRFNDGWRPVVKPEHFFTQHYHPSRLNQWRMEYDEYIAYVDAEFGRLIDSLERSGALENTILLFTSDHGEMFERGIFQHITPTLYEPIVRIPLLISRPGQPGREDVRSLTSCVDVLPTLMQLTGGQVPAWCEGQVLPPFPGSAESPDRSIFVVEAKSNPKQKALAKATVALRRGSYKLIHYLGYAGFEDRYELYDVENDPEELEDIVSSNTVVASDLRDELARKLQEVNAPYR